MNDLIQTIYIISWILCILIAFALLVCLLQKLIYFTRELKYLNSEIARSTGSERQYWLRCKRKLLLSLLPFVKY